MITFAPMTIEALYNIFLQYPSVQTDTRKLKTGDLFFALNGPNFNGNAFAQKALDAGAVYAIIDDAKFEIPGKTILVENVLVALQQLANHHRKQFSIPFLAITGSNGKTTTKELVHAVLSEQYRVYTTEGNLNNHIGIPLTILKIKPDAELAVVEMGANHLREIASYCVIAEPTHGLITNCGKAHLEGFGSLEGVRKGKGELFEYLRAKPDATIFMMKDYEYLGAMSAGIKNVITYGTRAATITGNIADQSSTMLIVDIMIEDEPLSIHSQLVGDYNLPNVLAAVAVGHAFGVPLKNIKKAIEAFTPSNSRSQLIEDGYNKIILDAYNANPSSMALAIENFSHISAPKKVLMLGAMAEMGEASEGEHKLLIDQIEQHHWDQVVLVGKPFEPFKTRYHHFENSTDAAKWVGQQNFDQTYFLIKGSRSSKMEEILNAIVNK
ncbi:MAG TPA: UDP-N-acetylmuramoyl-tripeptide--D-alanyl-D-alanine ligase [Niabella sp.]|nr:UDP-N-acetylmuramoyl-tripeptide--D-alanyl-D-alanine ligase [Niabella sp.]HRB35232.1 UDP-N-acetylmuramoyl-tripeptide--D-alanyl-D-alanine ligase [Niabella sp.]HRB61671.1 UDP-N-acetylmuramoyl-tripeptide--D-alanyl-D-alanine ligase [Niabella sp.]HRC01971.1 UDP-N-acetylmuramoyl-tripeptide--D-alanyl-D-alanine ligase [Niabella sp.]